MIFRLEYCNKFGDAVRVDITTPGLPTVVEVEGAGDPFRLKYTPDIPDKSFRFLTSSAEINIYETPEFNIDALKTSSETDIKVERYINGVKDWVGFVLPDFFSKEIRGNAIVSMTASDRISTLKSVTLSDLPAKVSIRELAVECLDKTGLSLPLKTMADFTESGEDDAYFRSEIPSQRLVDNKGRSISCYDVLSSILVTSNSFLEQREGEWYIINKLQHELGAGKLFSTETASTNYLEVTHNFSEITKGAMRTIIPVAASVGVFHEHGGGMMHPDNYDFSNGLSGWTAVNGFNMEIENRQVKGYYQPVPGYPQWEPIYGEVTNKNKLVNLKNESDGFSDSNINERPYVEASAPLVYADKSRSVEVSVNVSITTMRNDAIALVVLAEKGSTVLGLNRSGQFVPFVPTDDSFRLYMLVDSEGNSDNSRDKVVIEKGVIEQRDLSGYTIKIRIYGSGPTQTSFVNFASISFKNTKEVPKGNLYKREQGNNYTKSHDIETTIFGDYITGGLNGYLYDYPIDDTSSLYSPYDNLREKWIDPTDHNGEELPLLQHVVRQKARMFSVAHDLISGEIEMRDFDPLSIFTDCNGKRYVVVSASFDFLRSSVNVELEEIAYANLTVRDFIYSYFGEGESNIKSVGGIASGSGGGGGAGGGGMTSDQIAILNDVAELAHSHENKEVLDQVTQDMVDNASREMVISTDTETELTDENYLSSLRTIKEITERSLSKINPDTAEKLITFLEGLEIGDFNPGLFGSGGTFRMNDGVSELEVDKLLVRMRAEFFSVLIHNAKHIGGELIISAADMICIKVEEFSSFYRCYFDRGENNEVNNLFTNQDRARCQVFTGSGQKFYWRKVIAVGSDYIELSKTDASPGTNDIPAAGDHIFQLGSDNPDRQSAIILSSVGIDAPSWKQYEGINSFSLEDKETTVFSSKGNKIQGKTVFTSGGQNLDEFADGVAGDIQDTQQSASEADQKAQQAIDAAAANVTDYNAKFAAQQAQIDGEVSNWFYPYSPTLSNYPASDWTTNAIKDRHIGDTFTNTQPSPATDAGKSWRFVKNGSTYSWTQIADSDAVKALQQAAQAQATADGKSTTFLVQPSNYHLGDTWVLNADRTVNGTAYKQGEILTATQDSTTFVEAHWIKRVRYTDDTAVNNLRIGNVNLARYSGAGYYLSSAGTLLGIYPSDRSKSSVVTESGISAIQVQGGGTLRINQITGLTSGKTYTWRIMIKGTTGLSGTWHHWITSVYGSATLNITTEWAVYTKTFICQGNAEILHIVNISDTFFVADWMLVEGNRVTEGWSANILDVEAEIDSAKLTAEQAQLAADGYMRARYVRDWLNGSSINTANTWNEIKIVNKSGTNLALGKTATSNDAFRLPVERITDNDTTTFSGTTYTSGVVTNTYIQIDLGQIYYDIDYIQIWHYYADGRTYYGTKTEISEDGVNWTTIFDSAVSGKYQETEQGKVHTQRYASVLAKLNTSAAITDKFGTTIDGGLVNTVTMELREAGSQNVTAGISGIQNGGNGVAFWAGGTYAQAIAGTAKAIIRHDGSVKFTDADISGKISSANSGDRITIDPVARKMQFMSSDDLVFIDMAFDVVGSDKTSRMRINSYLGSSLIQYTDYRARGMESFNTSGGYQGSFGAGSMMVRSTPSYGLFSAETNRLESWANNKLIVTMSNLPTSSANLPAGTLYRNNNNQIMIV